MTKVEAYEAAGSDSSDLSFDGEKTFDSRLEEMAIAQEKATEPVQVEEDTDGGVKKLIYEEEDTHTKIVLPYWYILHPNMKFRQVFDIVVGVCLIYNVMVIPFRVCFNVLAEGGFFILETFMDGMFLLDLILNFFTAVYVRGVLVYEPREIVAQYFRGWFWVDFFSAFPFDYVVEGIANQSNNRNLLRLPRILRLVRLVRLYRLLKLFRLTRLYRKWKAHIQINSSIFRLLKLFVLILVLSHFLACFWFLTAQLEPTHKKGPTWLIEEGLEDAYVFDQYVASVYWAITTITTVGYGDITATTTDERVFIIIAMMLGVSVFSYSVGMMSYLVHRMDDDPTQDRMDQVNAYMKFRKLPAELQVAIRQHYLFAWSRQKAVWDETQIMSELSQRLRLEVGMHLKDKVLKHNPLFEGTSPEFITEVILRLEPQAAGPGDYIIREGQSGREMYILSRGVVEVCNADGSVVYKTLHAGSFFGEIALFTEDSLRTASVRAITHCELDVLTRDDFKDLLEAFPVDRDRLGILNTAQSRIRHMTAVHRRYGSVVDSDSDNDDGVGVSGLRGAQAIQRLRATSVDISNLYGHDDNMSGRSLSSGVTRAVIHEEDESGESDGEMASRNGITPQDSLRRIPGAVSSDSLTEKENAILSGKPVYNTSERHTSTGERRASVSARPRNISSLRTQQARVASMGRRGSMELSMSGRRMSIDRRASAAGMSARTPTGGTPTMQTSPPARQAPAADTMMRVVVSRASSRDKKKLLTLPVSSLSYSLLVRTAGAKLGVRGSDVVRAELVEGDVTVELESDADVSQLTDGDYVVLYAKGEE